MDMQKVFLQKLRLCVSREVRNNELEDIRCPELALDIYANHLARTMLVTLTADIAAGKIGDAYKDVTHTLTCETVTPASWFDHFKHDLFPGWLKAIFPPRYRRDSRTETKTTRVHYEQCIALPDLRLPDGGRVLHFTRHAAN